MPADDTGSTAPAPRVADFPRSLRFRMVGAYRVVSRVPDVYEATHDEIDAGFARILDNQHLRLMAVQQREWTWRPRSNG
jgi:hypothetical protein